MKILIVDDNRDNLYVLGTLLRARGYEVVSAINGSEALEKLRAEATDMVISDILMPVMDGFQLCREVKRDDELKDILFVFNTGTYTDEKDEELAFKMGADKFIRKPIEPDEFIKIIQAMMKDVKKGKLEPKKLAFEEEKEILKLYNERLVKKLERKMLDLEREITERKRAEERLRLLSSAIEQSSDGIAVTDLEGNLLFVNNAFATMHGYAAEELVGRHFSLFHTTEQMPSVEAANRQMQNTGEFSGEIWHVGRGGMVFPTLMHNSLLRDEAGNVIGMIGSLIDITEQKRAEKALRESEERYRELFETSLDGIAVTDIGGCYLDCNQAYLDLLGYDGVDELRSRSYEEVTPPEYHEFEDRIIKEQTLVRGYCDEYEKEYIRKTGERIPVTLRAWFRRGPDNQPDGMWVIVRDITERKQADEVLRESEERLRYLSSQLITAQEEERKGISLELHDEMGQTLTAIGLNLESIGKELTPEHAAMIKDKLAETISLVEHASDHVRDLSLDLRPSMLDDLGLLPTLRWYVNSYEKRTETPVIFEALNLGERLAPEVEIVLYRIVQESLNNIRKHAQAKKIKLRLEQKKKKIGVLIEDDGIGFYPDRVVSETTLVKGIGLLGMQERVRLLRGSFKIRSREGQGTSIFVELPLH
jgi:PAS domain S-box-containing protein